MKNLFRSEYALLLLLPLVWGCTKGDAEGPDGLSHVISVTTTTSPTSRSAIIGSEADMVDFVFFCTYTGTSDWSDSAPIAKMFNQRMIKSTTNTTPGHYGYWEYDGTPIQWNSGTGTSLDDRYTFFGYAPHAPTSTVATSSDYMVVLTATEVTSQGGPAGVPHIRYTVPVNNADQPDLLVAMMRRNIRPTGNPVALHMDHALTAVGFRVTGQGQQIASITLTGFIDNGVVRLDDGSWTPGTNVTTEDYSVPLKSYTADNVGNVMADDGFLMMVPQTLNSDVKATITFDPSEGLDPLVVSLTNAPTHTDWVAGHRVIYGIRLTDAGSVTVSRETVELPWTGINTATSSFELMCEDRSGAPVTIEWTLDVDQSATPWLRLSLDPTATWSTATYSISGNVSGTVYLFVNYNFAITQRTADITMDGVAMVTVIQLKPPHDLETPGWGADW